MKRSTFDKIVSWAGISLAALLIVAGSLLTWAHNFVHHEVHNQLAAQQIYFPAKDSPAIQAPEYSAMKQYAGKQLLTGAQAEVYADHFIANHLKSAGGGLTYSQLSAKYNALSPDAQAAPDGVKLSGQVATMFKGETLRGLLLNAYAFDTMGNIAGIAAIVSWVGAGVLAALGGLGLWHSRRVPATKEVFGGQHEAIEPVATA